MSSERDVLQNRAKSKRVARLRADGVPVREVAALVGVKKTQVRTLELMGQRLIELEQGS